MVPPSHADCASMGIRDKPTAPASPWQHGFAERLIGSIRRECVDRVIVLGEMHLRQVLKSYAVLAATGYNFRRLIRWLRLLWRQILAALFPELLINPA
jgi:integrase-like protein